MIIWPNHLFSDRISSIYKVVLDGWPSGLCTNTSNKLFSCKAAYFTSKEHCLKTFLIINLDLFHHNFWLIPAIIPLQLPLIIWVSQLHDHPLNIFFSFIFMFDFIERRREGKREGEKHWCERQTLVAFHVHSGWSPNPQLTHVPLPGIKLETSQFVGRYPTNRATQAGTTHNSR